MQDYISITHNWADLEKTFWKLSIFLYIQFVLISKFDIYIPPKVKKKGALLQLLKYQNLIQLFSDYLSIIYFKRF